MAAPRAFVARWALLDGQLCPDVRIDVDADGRVERVGPARAPAGPAMRRTFGNALVLPGFVNTHSHAFQRGIRGQTHQRTAHAPSSFWSWRTAMYAATAQLGPDQLYAVSRAAFTEMLRAGITRVGEFHYLHHQPDGTPYDDPNELSWRVIAAAADAGIRLTLLSVFYARAGARQAPRPEQRRFCAGSVDRYLQRIDTLRAAGVDVGLAPHSTRAVDRDALRELVQYASRHNLVMHTHLSEQPRENEECVAEHGMTPAALFAEVGAFERPRSFTAVHATHLGDGDAARLAGQTVCACPTTEADLGDGILHASALAAHGCALALGTDSNAIIDMVQEARLLEMHERLARRARLCLNDASGSLGPALAHAATEGGGSALGHRATFTPGALFDAVIVDLDHPFFALVPPERSLDALFTAGTAAVVREVIVGGVEML